MPTGFKKLDFHLSHFTILSTNNFGKIRREYFERSNIFIHVKI